MQNAIQTQAVFDTSFEQRLAKVNLDAVMQHVAKDTGLMGADLARAEDLYRKFLTLIATFPQSGIVPPRLVDEVWHAHITFTRQYMSDCELLFGEYLHHNPSAEGDDTSADFETITVPAYQSEFGINLLAYGMEEEMKAAGCRGMHAAGCRGMMAAGCRG